MLRKLHPTNQEFKRMANSTTTLSLYPKMVYFLKTNKKGKIIDESLEILQHHMKTKLSEISKSE